MYFLQKPGGMQTETGLYSANNTANKHNYNVFDKCLELLRQLYNYRFIEKITRPIHKEQRLDYVNWYGKKLWALNNQIQALQKQGDRDQVITSSTKNNPNQKSKSIMSTKSKTVDIRKQTKYLYDMYIEVLRQGSFKHYPKVAKIYNLPDLPILDIDNLKVSYKSEKKKRKCC